MTKIKVYNILCCTGSRIIYYLFRYTQWREGVLYNLSACILSTENEALMITCLAYMSALNWYGTGTAVGHDNIVFGIFSSI